MSVHVDLKEKKRTYFGILDCLRRKSKDKNVIPCLQKDKEALDKIMTTSRVRIFSPKIYEYWAKHIRDLSKQDVTIQERIKNKGRLLLVSHKGYPIPCEFSRMIMEELCNTERLPPRQMTKKEN